MTDECIVSRVRPSRRSAIVVSAAAAAAGLTYVHSHPPSPSRV